MCELPEELVVLHIEKPIPAMGVTTEGRKDFILKFI
jgi:hypothetical protein